MTRFIVICLFSFLCNHCGIEVGNPFAEDDNGKKKSRTQPEVIDKNGELTLTIARTNFDDAKHVYLYIDTIDLKVDSGKSFTIDIDESKAIDLLNPEDGLKSIVTSAQKIEKGKYNALTLKAKKDEPMVVVDASGKKNQVSLPANNAFTVDVDFQLSAKEKKDLIIYFNLGRDLKLNSTGAYAFNPQAQSVEKTESSSIAGRLNNTSFGVVCAYKDGQGSDSVTESKAEATTTTTSNSNASSASCSGSASSSSSGGGAAAASASCSASSSSNSGSDSAASSEAKVEVKSASCAGDASTTLEKDGSFSLPYLQPGSYDLIAFTDSGAKKLTETITLDPGENRELGTIYPISNSLHKK